MRPNGSTLPDRILTVPKARAYALVAIGFFALAYALGVLRRHGLIDGFGHVIGGDLLAFRTGAMIVRDGLGDRLYDFALQARYQEAAVAPEALRGIIPFTSPPFVALAYLPLAWLPHGVAFALWTVLAIGCVPLAFRSLRSLAPDTASHIGDATLLTLSFAPVLEGLAAGSNSIVSLPIFAAVLAALAAGRDATAGMLLGMQLFRPQLLFAPLVLLAWKRRWRALAGFLAVTAVLCVASIVCVAPGSLRAWVALVPLLSRMIFEPGVPTALFSSVHAIFLLPLGPQHFELGVIAGTIAAIALLCALLWVWSGPWRVDALRLAALVVVTPLVSEYPQLHDLTIVVLAGVLLVEDTLRRPVEGSTTRVRLALAALWIACLVAPAVVTRVAPIALAPIATLLLGWTILGERARRGVTAA